jgi:hypothetical protein
MKADYSWKIGEISGRKQFTDKNGNTRENVIKSVQVIFKGEFNGRTEQITRIVDFSLIDLSNFEDEKNLTNEIVLNWALAKISDLEKEHIEIAVKSKLEYVPNNSVNIVLKD